MRLLCAALLAAVAGPTSASEASARLATGAAAPEDVRAYAAEAPGVEVDTRPTAGAAASEGVKAYAAGAPGVEAGIQVRAAGAPGVAREPVPWLPARASAQAAPAPADARSLQLGSPNVQDLTSDGANALSSATSAIGSTAQHIAVDPLGSLEEITFIVVIIIVLILACKFHKQILILFTGDDKLHTTHLGAIWWGCGTCCGACTHEWTRCLTRYCLCLPRRLRGANLMTEFGAQLGLAPHTVEISNVVVGDLPFYGRGDFYMTVECSSNPPLTTSLAKHTSSKVVHFPEVLTLRIRSSSHKQETVKITIFELNVIGSEKLCTITLSADKVIKWAIESDYDEAPLKRFGMTPHNQYIDVETPPWIALEFNQAAEVRNLDTLGPDTVRTASWGSLGNLGSPTGMSSFEERSMVDFKTKYSLVNSQGHRVPEIKEEYLARFSRYDACCQLVLALCNWLSVAAVIGYLLLRWYLSECYTTFEDLTMFTLRSNGKGPFPVGELKLAETAKKCQEALPGTGIQPGQHPCSPSIDQVMDICEKLPEGQPRPHLLTSALPLEDLVFQGFTCSADACQWHQYLDKFDAVVLVFCVALLIFSCFCMRCFVNRSVNAERQQLLAKSMEDDHGRFRGGAKLGKRRDMSLHGQTRPS